MLHVDHIALALPRRAEKLRRNLNHVGRCVWIMCSKTGELKTMVKSFALHLSIVSLGNMQRR